MAITKYLDKNGVSKMFSLIKNNFLTKTETLTEIYNLNNLLVQWKGNVKTTSGGDELLADLISPHFFEYNKNLNVIVVINDKIIKGQMANEGDGFCRLSDKYADVALTIDEEEGITIIEVAFNTSARPSQLNKVEIYQYINGIVDCGEY